MIWIERKKLLIYFTVIYIIGFYLWHFFGSSDDGAQTLVANIFSLLAPLLAAILLLNVSRRAARGYQNFWQLLSFGGFSFAAGQLEENFFPIQLQFPLLSSFFYLLQLIFYLSALIHIIKIHYTNLHLTKFIFDTCIIMTAAITFSWGFIIREMLVDHQYLSLGIFKLDGNPIGDLILLFIAVCLYLGSHNFLQPKVLFFMHGSLLIQAAADTVSFFAPPDSAVLIRPFISLSFLLIAISGIFALEVPDRSAASQLGQSKFSPKHLVTFRLLLPYLSVMALFLAAVFEKIEDLGLMTGTAVAILLILFRQIFSSVENQTLLSKYHKLTEELEQKIGERTKELSAKNQQLLSAVKNMKHMAFHDVLSGLPNRRLFLARLLMAMEEAKRGQYSIAVIFIDLDRFKNINDTLGHDFGDLLLKYVSKQMSRSVRKTDTVSRQGGDEFTIILDKISSKEEIIPLIERLRTIVAKPIKIKGEELHVSMSIGIALYPKDGSSSEELMKNADMAMYCAKEEGRDNYKFFAKGMNQIISRKVALESGLRKAITHDEFVLYYQPQVDITTGKVVGIESLLRWNNIEAGMVSPKEFIPVAEETGLIIPIGEWVLYTACRQAKAWHDAGHTDLKLAVNLSPVQFLHENLMNTIATVLKRTGFNPNYLELEITEGVAFNDAEEAIKKMQLIRDLGVRISIDDFGTGYSSLIYLKRFPINTLKIALPFIQDITKNQKDRALVEAIAVMAHSLKLSIIAEGAETEEQLNILRELNCDVVQGEVFSKPLTVMQLSALIEGEQMANQQ